MGMRHAVGTALKAAGMYQVAKTVHAAVSGREASRRSAHRRYLEFYRTLVRPGDLVFDVGANMGNRTGPLLELGARVVAVEPQPVCTAELTRLYAKHPGFTLEACALGPAPGQATMMVASAHAVSTLSKEMVERTTASGRFADIRWNREITVPLNTFDQLIDRHGVPAFTKIDVEGYEAHVLSGLSQPIPLVSLEFMREVIHVIDECNRKLATLGPYLWNYGLGEGMTLNLDRWVPFDELMSALRARPEPDLWGDVYARLT